MVESLHRKMLVACLRYDESIAESVTARYRAKSMQSDDLAASVAADRECVRTERVMRQAESEYMAALRSESTPSPDLS